MDFVQRGSVEWERMWNLLGAHPLNVGDKSCDCIFTGEAWQYMGSSMSKNGQWEHHFRHRRHPKTNNRENISIPASDDF